MYFSLLKLYGICKRVVILRYLDVMYTSDTLENLAILSCTKFKLSFFLQELYERLASEHGVCKVHTRDHSVCLHLSCSEGFEGKPKGLGGYCLFISNSHNIFDTESRKL